MKDGVTISVFQLADMFPDQETARKYLEERRWPEGTVCPKCGGMDRIGTRKGGYYRCNACKADFTVRTGTIFERSHIPLHKWIWAMYLLVTARKGISSMQLSKELSITQKSAWFMLQRLREAMGSDMEALRGIVQIDETLVGGKKKNMTAGKRANYARGGSKGKTIVIGMRENGGRTKAHPIKSISIESIREAVTQSVAPGTILHTDELPAYQALVPEYGHASVCHKDKEYTRGDVTTNGIESVWAVMKRGLNGVYHRASKKHLARYVNEFTFRLNQGNVKVRTMDRIDSLIDATTGKRITYRELTQ